MQAPAAGYEVFGPGQPPVLCVNLELHRFAKSGVTVLQQRGAVLAGEERAFAADLVKWARESGFKVREPHTDHLRCHFWYSIVGRAALQGACAMIVRSNAVRIVCRYEGVLAVSFFFFFFWQPIPPPRCCVCVFCLSQDILALTGADAAEGLDPTPIGRGGMKRFRAGSSVEASQVRGGDK